MTTKKKPEAEPFTPQFMDIHYGHELRQLLIAATTWEACRRGVDRGIPPHLDNMAEDSVFIHSRNLYDLFLSGTQTYADRRRVLGLQGPLAAFVYVGSLIAALHDKALHVNLSRPYAPSGKVADDLPSRVLDLALEALGLWDEAAESVLPPFREGMRRGRERAVAEADRMAAWFEIDPLFQ